MSSRPSVTGEHACRVLERFGFVRKKRTSGSHFILVHGESKRIVPVPVHRGQTLPKGTLKSVIKLSGIPESEFFDAL